MSNGREKLKAIAKKIEEARANNSDPTPCKLTVRQFLAWFGAKRRGAFIVSDIRNGLEQSNLCTIPDFELAYIDGTISIESILMTSANTSLEITDPTYRIGMLEAANNEPTSIRPDNNLNAAVTAMLCNDFSQLPVMTSKRDVKGVISWKSIGTRLSLGRICEKVSDCMDSAQVINSDELLFSTIDIIAEHDYVLVRGNDQVITGIVTASDLSNQFLQLAEPFLLVGQIEKYVRRLIQGKFTIEQLRSAKHNLDDNRVIEGPSDLTIGELCRLLQNQQHWDLLNVSIDRSEFVKQLDSISVIRNDVMHFDPAGLSDEDLKKLRDFARFFQTLTSVGFM